MFPIKDTIPSREFPFVTWGIIVFTALVFLFETSLNERGLTLLFHYFGMVPIRYSTTGWEDLFPLSYLPFVTNIFLHGGWMHIISNMWTLYIFGDNVEDRMGHLPFLLFYLLSGIIANITYYLFNPYSTIPVVGASGAIAGVMGAYFVMFPFSRVITLIPLFFIPYFIEVPAFLYLMVWFIIQLYSGSFSLISPGLGGGIAWWAHIGGFLGGILLLPLFVRRKRRRVFLDEFFRDFI